MRIKVGDHVRIVVVGVTGLIVGGQQARGERRFTVLLDWPSKTSGGGERFTRVALESGLEIVA